jgi:hypothetical protein
MEGARRATPPARSIRTAVWSDIRLSSATTRRPSSVSTCFSKSFSPGSLPQSTNRRNQPSFRIKNSYIMQMAKNPRIELFDRFPAPTKLLYLKQ